VCACIECIAVTDDAHAVRIAIAEPSKADGKAGSKTGGVAVKGGIVEAASPLAPIAYEENACACGVRVCGASSALWCAQQPFGCCSGGRGRDRGHDDDDDNDDNDDESAGVARTQACVDPRCCSTFPADCCTVVSRACVTCKCTDGWLRLLVFVVVARDFLF
jgi:hypothetical protein